MSVNGKIVSKIPEFLKDSDMSVTQFAGLTDISYGTAHKLSKGGLPSIGIVERICRMWNLTVGDIIEYVG